MNRQTISILGIIFISALIALWIFRSEPHTTAGGHDHDHGGHGDLGENMPRGPHGGRLLLQDHFALELAIFETGVPPELHVYAYHDDTPVDPAQVRLNIKLHRTGGQTDAIGFVPQQDYLRGDAVIYEPHSFEVEVNAEYNGATYHWRYENFEGRTQIPVAMARTMGIASETVGPVILRQTLTLSGQVHTNPNRLARVRPRFPGVVTVINAELGQEVKAGEILARVQSNESLQTYTVKAPIAGLIVQRDLQVGEATGTEPLFIIVDTAQVWVELDVFSRDLDKVRVGQTVTVETLDGTLTREGRIDWLSPLTAHASQSVRARIPLANPAGELRPGQYVRGHVVVGEHPVELAVRQSALQRFRDFQVVFARFDDIYEVRMLELGRSNSEWVEVLGGIAPGTEYVTQHSYLIKADIEKSGASHDH